MIDDFCAIFIPGGEVIYIGDADSKLRHFDKEKLASLGVAVNAHGKLPDLVVYPGGEGLAVPDGGGVVAWTRLCKAPRRTRGAVRRQYGGIGLRLMLPGSIDDAEVPRRPGVGDGSLVRARSDALDPPQR